MIKVIGRVLTFFAVLGGLIWMAVSVAPSAELAQPASDGTVLIRLGLLFGAYILLLLGIDLGPKRLASGQEDRN